MSRRLTGVPRDPTDPRYQQLKNLQLVRSGVRSRAPGIRRCPACREPWINDGTGLSWCETCRIGRQRKCAHCAATFTLTEQGERLCQSCTEQIPLF